MNKRIRDTQRHIRYLAYGTKRTTQTARYLYKLGFTPLFIAAGMPRSGSTIIYNVMRLCLMTRYGDTLASGWLGDLQTLPRGSAVLLKAHRVDPALKMRARTIVYSFRDVREVLISAHRRFNQPPSFDQCARYIHEYKRAARYADMMLKYEDFVNDVNGLILTIADGLELIVDPRDIREHLPKVQRAPTMLAKEKHSYHPVTQMHGPHGTGVTPADWKRELDPQLKDRICHEFGWWLVKHGYECS